MCKYNRSKTLASINALCIAQNLDPDLIYEKSRLLLESYKRICWVSFGTNTITDNKDQAVKAMTFLNSFSPAEDHYVLEQKLTLYFNKTTLTDIINSAMINVKNFPEMGDLYFDILSKKYLSSFKYSESDMMDLFSLERSRYYDRKKEAMMIFGFSLWGNIIPQISSVISTDTDSRQYSD